jgi:hypothetical protein
MAYNRGGSHVSVNTAEQVLQQSQIPFDIIFNEQINHLDKYAVLVLANQESLSDEVLDRILQFVQNGGGLVLTENTGRYDQWRRLRQERGFHQIFATSGTSWTNNIDIPIAVTFGQGRALYLPEIILSEEDHHKTWKIPVNAEELEAAIHYVSGKPLPLDVDAPEWIGVSHDSQPDKDRDIVHLFNYRNDGQVAGITLKHQANVKSVWAVSPQRDRRIELAFEKSKDATIIWLPALDVYEVVVIEY